MKIDSYRIIIGNCTDTGKVRSGNEDYMAHFDTPYGYCVIVCDGMGGHAAGDRASFEAVEAIKHYLQNGNLTRLATPDSMINAIEFANYQIRQLVRENPALTGMGTTIVMAIFHGAQMYIAHAGDSRIYLLRKNSIKQLTKDHSTVQKLIDAGILSAEEAQLSDKKNQITKAIGIFERVEPVVSRYPVHLKHNDRILLCSDGLTAHLDQKEIFSAVKGRTDAQETALKLVERANLSGGSDNITVQLVHYYGKTTVRIKRKISRKKIILTGIVFLIILASGYFAYKKIFPLVSKNEVNEELKVPSVVTDSTYVPDK